MIGLPPFTWNETTVADLRRMHADDVPFSDMAAAFAGSYSRPPSRNACIGKARRIGLPERRTITGWSSQVKVRRIPAPSIPPGMAQYVGRELSKGLPPVKKTKGSSKAPSPASPSAPESGQADVDPGVTFQEPARKPDGRVTLIDLRNGMCRWPIGDPREDSFHYCGADADIPSSYCVAHRKVAYLPSRRPRPQHSDEANEKRRFAMLKKWTTSANAPRSFKAFDRFQQEKG